MAMSESFVFVRCGSSCFKGPTDVWDTEGMSALCVLLVVFCGLWFFVCCCEREGQLWLVGLLCFCLRFS